MTVFLYRNFMSSLETMLNLREAKALYYSIIVTFILKNSNFKEKFKGIIINYNIEKRNLEYKSFRHL